MLTRAIPTPKIKFLQVATIILNRLVMPYGIPSYVVTDNKPQFVSKFLTMFCLFLGVKGPMTAAYHRHTNGQVEQYNRTLVASLRHYVSELQRDWDTYAQPLTNGYNTETYRAKEHARSTSSYHESCHQPHHLDV